jgi:hypothetical protein
VLLLGLALKDSVVVIGACVLIVTLMLDAVAAAKFASPEYEAVMMAVPIGREVTFRVATPFESAAVPRLVPSL